jgi:hypothetical protein
VLVLRLGESAPGDGTRPAASFNGLPSSSINGELVRALFVYRDVAQTVALAERTADLSPRGIPWRVPALANLAFLRYLSGDGRAARAAVADAERDADAAFRPHSMINALATKALAELDDEGLASIYRKLGAGSRADAVVRAWELGLLGAVGAQAVTRVISARSSGSGGLHP